MEIGIRVKTPKYGNGTVIKIEMVHRYTWRDSPLVPTGRIGVKLDNPELWPCSPLSNDTAYYYPSELEALEQ